jgi:DNA mismatch repair ATPase MutS
MFTFAPMEPINHLKKLHDQSLVEIKALKKKVLVFAMLRFAVFLIGAAVVYLFWGDIRMILIVLLPIAAIFLSLIRRHANYKESLKIEKAYADNCATEIKLLQGHWRNRDSGVEFMDGDHPYADDLSVFGRHGLFQFLNRCETELARSTLAGWLKTTLTDKASIEREKSRIESIALKPAFMLKLLAHAGFAKASKGLHTELKEWVDHTEFKRGKAAWVLFTIIVPVIALVATALYASSLISGNLYLLILLLPGLLIMGNFATHKSRFDKLLKVLEHADQFYEILNLIRETDFDSAEIDSLYAEADLERSQQGLKKLKRLVGAVESRNNIFVSIVFNLLLMYDFQCARLLQKWKNEYAGSLLKWMELVNSFEAYSSFGLYTFGHPNFTYSEFTDVNDFSISGARHVLMDEKAVPNPLELTGQKRFSIITGANMAGKSTYLRMVGINMVLAMRGLPVPVKEMAIKPTKIFTSMLSADSLGENESYFFNELKRLRQMTDRLEAGEPNFIILDEILKGTNSIDKAQGSRRFMEKMLKLPAKGLIATHDLSLCKLSDEHTGVIENTKFEVRFDGDELAFDYKLEKGVCENMNASFLLKKMGLSE